MQEMLTMLQGRRLEQNVMEIMPFGISLYIAAAYPGYFGTLTIQHSYILPAFQKSIFQRISASQRICHRQDAFLELHGQFLSVLPTLSVDAPAKIENPQREQ